MLGTTRRLARRAVLAGAALASVLAAGLVSRSAAAVQPAACPARAVARVPANGWSAARRELIPGAPGALRLCRYGGVNSTLPLALARSRLLTGRPPIARLTSEFDALPPARGFPCTAPPRMGPRSSYRSPTPPASG